MPRTFSIETGTNQSSLLARFRKAARENGANLVGDGRAGRFSHYAIEGEYRMVGRTVFVTITEKPAIVPWSIVETRLREFVRQAD